MSVDSLFDAALGLSEDQRAELIDRLLDSLPSQIPSELHPAWRSVVQRRSAELADGTVAAIPWDDVRRSAWEEIDGAKPRD